jgi:hypothetical protein
MVKRLFFCDNVWGLTTSAALEMNELDVIMNEVDISKDRYWIFLDLAPRDDLGRATEGQTTRLDLQDDVFRVLDRRSSEPHTLGSDATLPSHWPGMTSPQQKESI